MKKQLLLTTLFLVNIIFAQTTVDFESLIVPDSGFFNGSTEYTGNGDPQMIYYSDNGANLYVNYADTGAYDYWNGFSYSNQTDLTTASWTNYSAYSINGGGANSSSNYVIAYVYAGDSLTFDNPATVSSMAITNSVWAYHYMNGSDGTGTGTYVADDYFTLTITAILTDGSSGNSLDFQLADFTNGNAYIIDDWTTVDLTSLGEVSGLEFQLSSSDSYTPFYFCMDNIVYETTASVSENFSENNINVFPNPSLGIFKISNITNANITIFDLNGRQILSNPNYSENQNINLSTFNSGIYFVKIEKDNQVITKKLILK